MQVLHESWPHALELDTLIETAQARQAEAGIVSDLPLKRAKSLLGR